MHEEIQNIIKEQYRAYVLVPFNKNHPEKQEEYRRKIFEEVRNCVRRVELEIVFASDIIKYLGYE